MPRERLPSHPVVICGAKRRDGMACQATALPNGKCRMHGGNNPGAPKGSQNALKLGMYARFMSQADRDAVADSQIGSLEAEINVVKAQLARTLAAQAAYDETVAAGEVPLKHLLITRLTESSSKKTDENDETAGESSTSTTKTVTNYATDKVLERPDFEGLIDRWTGRLDKLEKTHALLTGQINSDGEGSSATVTVRVIGGLANTAPKTGN